MEKRRNIGTARMLRRSMTNAELALWRGHHTEQVDADAERTAYLEGKGFRVIRFWNNEVLTETDGVATRLFATLTPTPLPPAGEWL